MWKSFYLDGIPGRILIDSPEDWKNVVNLYKVSRDAGVETLRAAKEDPDNCLSMPSFGFFWEYTGPLTLGQWADQQGMNLSVE